MLLIKYRFDTWYIVFNTEIPKVKSFLYQVCMCLQGYSKTMHESPLSAISSWYITKKHHQFITSFFFLIRFTFQHDVVWKHQDPLHYLFDVPWCQKPRTEDESRTIFHDGREFLRIYIKLGRLSVRTWLVLESLPTVPDIAYIYIIY